MKWSIQGYGENIPADNACWQHLVQIEVYENSRFKQIPKESMRIGQEGYAVFMACGVKSKCYVVRTH